MSKQQNQRSRAIKNASSRRANDFVISAVAMFVATCLGTVTTSAVATEIEIKPKITSIYTYVVDPEFNGFELDSSVEDGNQTLMLTPSISMLASGAVWNGQWTVSHTKIEQLESNFENTSFSDISLNNQFNFVKDRVVFSANASRKNQNIDNRFAGVSDPIFGQSEYVDVDNGTLGLTVKNKSGSDWRNSLNYSYSATRFDEDQLANTSTRSTQLVKGDRQNAEVRLAYGSRANQVKGEFRLAGNSNDRNVRGKQSNIAASFNLELPMWSALDFVLSGSASRNSIANSSFEDSNLDNEFYGAGLAWRFSERSYIAVTYNKDTQGQTRFSDADEEFDDTFVGYRLVLEPSKRTSLSYENSRRFYGESHNFKYNKSGNHWNINVGYAEDLTSQSRLVNDPISAGIYSCNPISLERVDCIPLSRIPDRPDPRREYIEFFDPNFFIDEELVLSKGLNASVSYKGRKSTLTLSYAKSKRQFLERDNDEFGNEQDSESFSINYNHRMSRRTSFNASANQTDVDSNGTRGDRKGFQASVGLERKLTRKATGKLNIRRFDNDGNSIGQNRKDTRLEVQYSYQF
ncbi:porin family protein [Psychrosphaera aestuarii]|uniref:hypothetical protein n=1 Tax=Psychrosphaera aestuarii TaxID=1266052 RepID=UPI001B3208F7|nr:hypothetical protein [Psychrosphaera aestuarii]